MSTTGTHPGHHPSTLDVPQYYLWTIGVREDGISGYLIWGPK